MKKIFCTILFLSLLAATSQASTLYHIRFSFLPDKIRAVFDFDGEFSYQTQERREEIIIIFTGAKAGPEINNYVELNDIIVRYFEIEKTGEDLKVTIPLSEPIDYNIFYLNDPPRLVIDFGREFLNIVYGGLICDGAEFFKIKKGTSSGRIVANVLKVNANQAEVAPALAKKYKPNFLESFVNLFNPWARKSSNGKHFFLDKVSNIVEDNGGVAGINGTFFSYTGEPLGALMINGELVSSSIHDRTALFLDNNNRAYIDNVFISSYFKHKGKRYNVTGINQVLNEDGAVLYTPAWGENTSAKTASIEIAVEQSKVKEVNIANSKIPGNGYVLSLRGGEAERLAQEIKKGDEIELHLRIVPYSASPSEITHLVSGGPRLIKQGMIYVSKYEEKFRPDVAKRRAARTAIGIKPSGELLLVAVEGPSPATSKENSLQKKIGVTLEELSKLMLNLGAVEAMNLDGGSSTSMVIRGRAITGAERPVSNAIIVRERDL